MCAFTVQDSDHLNMSKRLGRERNLKLMMRACGLSCHIACSSFFFLVHSISTRYRSLLLSFMVPRVLSQAVAEGGVGRCMDNYLLRGTLLFTGQFAWSGTLGL